MPRPQLLAPLALLLAATALSAQEAAPVVKDKVVGAAEVAAQKVRGDSEPELSDEESGYPVAGR